MADRYLSTDVAPSEGARLVDDFTPTLLDLVDALAAEAVAVARAQKLDIDLSERVERIHAVLAEGGSG